MIDWLYTRFDYISLQTAYHLDDKAVERICLSLDLGLAAAHPDRYIYYGSNDKEISDDQLALILNKLFLIDKNLDVSLNRLPIPMVIFWIPQSQAASGVVSSGVFACFYIAALINPRKK